MLHIETLYVLKCQHYFMNQQWCTKNKTPQSKNKMKKHKKVYLGRVSSPPPKEVGQGPVDPSPHGQPKLTIEYWMKGSSEERPPRFRGGRYLMATRPPPRFQSRLEDPHPPSI